MFVSYITKVSRQNIAGLCWLAWSRIITVNELTIEKSKQSRIHVLCDEIICFRAFHETSWTLHHGLNVNLDVATPLHMSSNVSPELFALHQVTEVRLKRWLEDYHLTRLQEWIKYLLEFCKTVYPVHWQQLPTLWTTLFSPTRSHVHGKRQKLRLFLPRRP